MENAGYIALSRQVAVKRSMEIIANNIANLNTTGFRAERMVFAEHLNEMNSGHQLSMVHGVATVRDITEGNKVSTHNDLDVALIGDGYFALDTPYGERYTRSGALSIDTEGQLVSATGDPILGTNNRPLVVTDNSSITITQDGTVSDGNGAIGTLKVVTFEDEQSLVKLSAGQYDSDGQEPVESTTHRIRQGALESSNVNAIAELTRLMDVSRSNSSVSKMSKEEHERIMKAIRLLGSTSGI